MAVAPFYIITGPPSSGKTALINCISDLGYLCHQEMARLVIIDNKRNNIDCFPWNNTKDFSHQVFLRITNLLTKTTNTMCFFDRSIVDLIAYMDISKLKRNQLYIDTIKQVNYNKTVFFLEFWDEIYHNDNERTETRQQALIIEKYLIMVYQELGFNLVKVPKLNVDQRAEFILKKIEKFK